MKEMFQGHINVEITSFQKVKFVSLLQDFSESFTHNLCAKSPRDSHSMPNPSMGLVLEILFTSRN